jgi:hypothetical protein
MRKHASKIFAILFLIGITQTLAGCVIVDDDHYHRHYWHDRW